MFQLCYSSAYFLGTLSAAYACDTPLLGRRRRRAILINLLILLTNIATWSGMFYFLATRRLNRRHPSPKVDWTDNADFLKLLFLFIGLAFSTAMYQFYHIWLCSTFSNDPRKLGRLNGYMSALRLSGLATAYGIDSHKVSFLIEAETYFTISMIGIILALVSAYRYTTDTNYGSEDLVIAPDHSSSISASSTRSSDDVGGEIFSVQPEKR